MSAPSNLWAWKGKRNSELLAAAKGKFDVLVTSDSLLLQGQELETIGLGLVVVGTNRVAEVERLVPQLAAATMGGGSGERVMVPVAGPKSAR